MAPGAHLHLSGQKRGGKETEEQKPEVELQGAPCLGQGGAWWLLTGSGGDTGKVSGNQEGGRFPLALDETLFPLAGNHFSYCHYSALLPVPENSPSSQDQDGSSDSAGFGIYTGINHFFLA